MIIDTKRCTISTQIELDPNYTQTADRVTPTLTYSSKIKILLLLTTIYYYSTTTNYYSWILSKVLHTTTLSIEFTRRVVSRNREANLTHHFDAVIRCALYLVTKILLIVLISFLIVPFVVYN